jgi:hypothetical protein
MLAKRVWRPATLDIAALVTCLLGFLGLIFIVYRLKTGAVGTPRAILLLTLAMICAPFYVAFVRTPKIPFLFAPVFAIFLLYPIATPHGVVYSTDPIFNFSFTEDLIDTGLWAPGSGLAFAHTYSFYPVGNVFVGYVILNAPLRPDIGYLWIEPVLRALSIPAIVYSIGRRLFGPRSAAVAVLLYLGTPSILFNEPVQQGFGTIFFGLSVLSLLLLSQAVAVRNQHRAQILFVLLGAAIVMTHHLTSYVFASWLTGLSFLLLRQRYRPEMPALRMGILFVYFIVILLVYIDLFTYPIFFGHEQTLTTTISNLVAPEDTIPGAPRPPLGRTFTPIEISWLASSLFIVFLLALFTVRRYRVTGHHPFMVANGIVALFLIFVTLPLIVTPLNYVPLRINEYTNFVIAPFAAATLIRWGRSDFWKSSRGLLRTLREKEWAPAAAAMAISAFLVMGGNLAPITFRMFFEPFPEFQATDSPLFLGVDSFRAANWAIDHFSTDPNCVPLNTCRIWGDQLAVDVFSGFGDMPSDFGSSKLFANTTLDQSAWRLLHIGDYVAVDSGMTRLRANFLHEGLWPTPLTEAQIGKFATDRHFALVYQDATFSVYRVMSIQQFCGTPPVPC